MKDAKGHGSNPRLRAVPSTPVQYSGGARPSFHGEYHNGEQWNKVRNSSGKPIEYENSDYALRAAGHESASSVSNATAAAAMASGPKSDVPPVREGMYSPNHRDSNAYQHPYNRESVNEAIKNSGRFGGGKIGGREARMIHAVLKGRG